jgi:hypothetical protein
MTLAPTCFGSRRNHHQGAVLCYKYGFSVLVGIDAVNVMAAYQPVVQACGSVPFSTVNRRSRSISWLHVVQKSG